MRLYIAVLTECKCSTETGAQKESNAQGLLALWLSRAISASKIQTEFMITVAYDEFTPALRIVNYTPPNYQAAACPQPLGRLA